MRQITQEGIDFIKRWEGCVLRPYRDAVGLWTIGVGHLIKPGEKFPERISMRTAEELLRKDIARFERSIIRNVSVPLSDNQFNTLVSFAFNVGTGAFQRSTLRMKLNREEYEAVPHELMKWTRAGGRRLQGLVNRRRAEAELWQNRI